MSIPNTNELKRRPTHPGEILREEFMADYQLSVKGLADSLGGVKAVADGYSIGGQVVIQALGVGLTVAWIGVVSIIGYSVAKLVFGLRVAEEDERQGLDITSHGESAYEV